MAKGNDPIKDGFVKSDFGGDDKMNHVIEGAYVGKQEYAGKIHEVALHEVDGGQMYSDDGSDGKK